VITKRQGVDVVENSDECALSSWIVIFCCPNVSKGWLVDA